MKAWLDARSRSFKQDHSVPADMRGGVTGNGIFDGISKMTQQALNPEQQSRQFTLSVATKPCKFKQTGKLAIWLFGFKRDSVLTAVYAN